MLVRTCPTCGAQNRIPPSKLEKTARCGKCKTELGSLDRPQTLASRVEFDDLIGQSPIPVLVDFWAPWCGPCRMVAPELEKLSKEKAGDLIVAKVNTDEVPDVASQFGIRSIPTLVLFRGGREAHRVSGAMQKAALVSALGL